MKTTIYKQNKSGSGLRTRLLGVGALITSMLLCSFVVLAQNNWQQLLSHSSMGEMARQMMIEKEEAAEISVSAHSSLSHFVVEEEVDRELTLESWMTDRQFRKINKHNCKNN